MAFRCSCSKRVRVAKSTDSRRDRIDWLGADQRRERTAKEIRPAMRDFFAAMQSAVPFKALEEALGSGNPSPVIDRITTPEIPRLDPDDLPARMAKAATPITPTGVAISSLATRTEEEEIAAALRFRTAMAGLVWANGEEVALELGASFTLRNPHTIPWLERRTAELVTEITASTREAIRETVAQAYLEGGSTARLARRIRPLIGLRSDQIRAVMRRAADLEASGASASSIDRAIGAYGRKLLRQRATLIARTETMFAQAAGRDQAWRVAAEEGLVPQGSVRIWIADPGERTCPICSELDGQEAPLGGAFEAFGELYYTEPAHPACRCTLVLSSRSSL